MRGAVLRHPLLRSLAKTTVVAASTASVGLNLVAFERATQGSVLGLDFGDLLQFVLLLGALSMLFLNETGRRCGAWALGLPVRARGLWTVHAQALVLAVVVVVLAMVLVVVGFAQLIGRLSGSDLLGLGPVLGHFVRPGAVLVTVALALAVWRPALADPEAAPGWGRFRILLAVGALALLGVLALLPTAWTAAPVLVAVAVAWRARAGLPAVLSLAEKTADARVRTTEYRRGGGAVNQLVTRQLFKWPVTWILGLPMILLLGLVIGGVANGAEDADFAQFFNLWIAIYLLVAFTMHFLENMGRVDHLPVSRVLLLRWLLLPGIAALVIGGLIGAAVDHWRTRPAEALVLDAWTEVYGSGLRVPPDVWEPVWGAAPAAVEAPWGESVAPESVELVRGLPLRLWKPYTTVPGSSADFVAWQVARAVARVHGVIIPADTIRDRYLVVDEAGRVGAREGGLTLVADGLAPRRGPIGPLLPLLLGAVVLGTLLAAWSMFRFLGPGATRRRVRVVFWTQMIALISLHLGGYGLLMARLVNEWTVAGLVRGWAGGFASLGPLGWVLPWLLFPLLAWPAWCLCARAFARVEAIRPEAGSCGW